MVYSWLRVFPFIITLATQYILNGATYLLSGGLSKTYRGLSEGFEILGGYNIPVGVGYLKSGVIVMVLMVLVGSFILNKTYFGRNVYALGSNPDAVALSGVSVAKMRILIFALAGFFFGVAQVVNIGKIGSVNNSMGIGMISSICTGQEIVYASVPKFTPEELIRMVDLLQETTGGFKTSVNPRMDGELCLIHLCQPSLSLDVRDLAARISRIEGSLADRITLMEQRLASGNYVPAQPQPEQQEEGPPPWGGWGYSSGEPGVGTAGDGKTGGGWQLGSDSAAVAAGGGAVGAAFPRPGVCQRPGK